MFSKYSRIARIYPTIISILPILTLSIYLTNTELNQFFYDLISLKILSNLTFSVILIYLLSQFNRFIAKNYFEKKYFDDELQIPTTNFLLFKNSEFSNEYKTKIRDFIFRDFKIQLPNAESEKENELMARKKIVEAVGLIRSKVKDGRLLLQHNIEYGFARNLIGGSIIGIVSSIVATSYFYHKLDIHYLSIFTFMLLIAYLFILKLSKYLITKFGILYARRLFQEYLST